MTSGGNGDPPVGLADKHDRTVTLLARGTPGEKQMKLAKVSMLEPEGGPWTMVCDEGPYLAGEGSAPPPLSYFAASIAFCLLTQIGRYAKIMRLAVDSVSVEVTARFRIEGSVREGTLRGAPLTFGFQFEIESQEDDADLQRLFEVSENSCYVTQSLLQPVAIDRSATLNGAPLALT